MQTALSEIVYEPTHGWLSLHLGVLIARSNGFVRALVWDTSIPNGKPQRKWDNARPEKSLKTRQ